MYRSRLKGVGFPCHRVQQQTHTQRTIQSKLKFISGYLNPKGGRGNSTSSSQSMSFNQKSVCPLPRARHREAWLSQYDSILGEGSQTAWVTRNQCYFLIPRLALEPLSQMITRTYSRRPPPLWPPALSFIPQRRPLTEFPGCLVSAGSSHKACG